MTTALAQELVNEAERAYQQYARVLGSCVTRWLEKHTEQDPEFNQQPWPRWQEDKEDHAQALATFGWQRAYEIVAVYTQPDREAGRG